MSSTRGIYLHPEGGRADLSDVELVQYTVWIQKRHVTTTEPKRYSRYLIHTAETHQTAPRHRWGWKREHMFYNIRSVMTAALS